MADTQPAPIKAELECPIEEPEPGAATADAAADDSEVSEPKAKRSKKNAPVKTREQRLEQNRKAARESRKRKKVLVEELQRSVIFFSRGEFLMCSLSATYCNIARLTPLSDSFHKQPMGHSVARMRKWNNFSSTPRLSFRHKRLNSKRQRCQRPM